MTPVVVAWVLQLAWEIVRSSLGSAAFTPRPIVLSFAVTLATTLVAAAGFAQGARRLSGRRRVGAVIACIAQLAMGAALIAREVLVQDHDFAVARVLRNGGWTGLEIVAIVGLAIAAGRRGWWVAPPAIGLVIFAVPPSTVWIAPLPPVSLVVRGIVIVLCGLLVDETRRKLAARDPDLRRGERGIVLDERLSWFFVAIEIASLATRNIATIVPSLTLAVVNIAGDIVFIVAIGMIVGARLPRLPRWPLYAAATCTAATLVRSTRVWLLTLTTHWGHLDAVPLKPVHWSYSVPGMLSSAFALAAYGAFAWSTRRRPTLIAVAASGVCLVAWSSLAIVGAAHLSRAAVLVVTNVTAALLYRSLRPAFRDDTPTARAL